MKKFSIRSVILGALITALVVALALPALAALDVKTMEVFTGLKVYVNDQLVDPRDSNGNPVDVVVINGTTYLPVRALGNALGMPVQYDGKTQSAYIGRHNSQEVAFYLDVFDYFTGSSSIYTKATEMDNLKGGHSRCIVDDFDRTYKLNGQYTRLTGNIYQTYDMRSDTIYGDKHGALYIYVDGELAYIKEFNNNTTGFEPEPVDVDLTGALEMRIIFRDGGYWLDSSDGPLSLGEMALYT